MGRFLIYNATALENLTVVDARKRRERRVVEMVAIAACSCEQFIAKYDIRTKLGRPKA